MQPVNVNLSNIDWELLRNQKEELVRIRQMRIDELHLPATQDELNNLSGIIHLLDSLQDQAAKTLGGNTVFGMKRFKVRMAYIQHATLEVEGDSIEDATTNAFQTAGVDFDKCEFQEDLEIPFTLEEIKEIS